APVLEKGATKRKLYLPKGLWYDFFDPSKTYNGGTWMEADVNNESIPVFVKGGSVLPMKPSFENTAFYPKEQLILHYYAAEGTSESMMYEDDGTTPNAINQKKFELIRMNASNKPGIVTLTLSGNGGLYNGKPTQRNVELFVYGVFKPKQVRVNNIIVKSMLHDDGVIHIPSFKWNGLKTILQLQ
ncbi:MAG TPA: DUF5110 domain-containing protein, partial [Lacibacter sp.]|nr:DUF5110 domain-containing protein [Lacibacter sp.]